MQVTQTLDQGLQREFKVVVPAQDLDERLVERLNTLKDRVNINGFRKGKVPLAHLKKLYGRSVMAEVVEQAVADANRKIVDDNGLRLAMQPKVSLPEGQDEVEGVISGRSDLSLTVALEVLPKVEVQDVSALTIERLVADVTDADVDEALERIAAQNRPFSDKGAEPAANGDRVKIDFVGKIDGEAFQGGTGADQTLELGTNTFIPGFEEQLIGLKAGDERTIAVTFPEAYARAEYAGKPATFDVTVHAVEAPGAVSVDDDLAKSLGLDSLEKLKETVRGQIEAEYGRVARQRAKRGLLDALDAQYAFDLPPTLVEQEFDNVWKRVVADLEAAKRTFEDEETTEEEARAEYRRIAERRVRLGLVLAEIGETHEIKITDDELTRAMVDRARQFPGQEQQVWDFYRKNPEAQAELRAPIFEEKVVDLILDKATVTDRKVDKETLLADPDGEEAEAPKAEAKAAKPKKAKKAAPAGESDTVES